MLKVYGIKNCDTVKKALKFLDSKELEYEFVDFKKVIPSDEDLLRWKDAMGEWPVNKRGRTFKEISEAFESGSDSEKISLMKEKTSAIKRPIIENGTKVVSFGFKAEQFEEIFS